MLLVILITQLILSHPFVAANSCTDTCDLAFNDGIEVKFCGTDYVTYTAHYSAISSRCYFNCGVMAQYAGSCNCPNNCFEEFGHGTCTATSDSVSNADSKQNSMQCSCKDSWGGNDCSLPATGNICSDHGTFHGADDSSNTISTNRCQCDPEFTGSNCQSPVFPYHAAPWGDLFPDGKEYSSKDKYQDDHPVFNLSVLATIHLTMPRDSLLSQLYTYNTYTADYVNASITFDNGDAVQQRLDNVGVKIKGAYSRMDFKKGWSIKFNKFVSGQKLKGLKKIGLKPGGDEDDVHLKNGLYTALQRAMGVPTPRGSYALLYINSVFYGVFFMVEDVDDGFMEERVEGDDGSGDLFQMNQDVFLQYEGDNVTYYQTSSIPYPTGDPQYRYELGSGPGQWDRLVDFLYYLNSSSQVDFLANIEQRVDVPSLLKGLVVESFLMGADGFVEGLNYYVYHLQTHTNTAAATTAATASQQSNPAKFMVFNNDFDEEFYYSSIGVPENNPDILGLIVKPTTDKYANPLLNRLFAEDRYQEQYINFYQTFLSQIFGSQSNLQPTVFYAGLMQFVLPWIAQDYLWRVSKGVNTANFVIDAEYTIANLGIRYSDTLAQVKEYLN